MQLHTHQIITILTERGSIVKAMYVLSGTQELHPYYGIFFRITIRDKQLELENMEFIYLAYVTLINFKSPERDKLSGLYMVNKTFYHRDRIISPRRFLGRCAPVEDKSSSFFVTDIPH